MDDLEEVAEDKHEEAGRKNTDGLEELKQMTKTQLKIVSITLKLFFKN